MIFQNTEAHFFSSHHYRLAVCKLSLFHSQVNMCNKFKRENVQV